MGENSFHDLDDYVAIPRLSGLVLTKDGTRLVTGVATLDSKRTKYVTALWEVDPEGVNQPRRLTRSAKGESSAAFTADGDLLFTSARPDPDKDADDDDPVPALWLLPRDGAEARVVADRAAGLGSVVVAADAPVVLVGSDVLPSRDATPRRREAAQGAQGEEGLGDPARRLPGPVLGPRPRPGVPAPVHRDPERARRRSRSRARRTPG